MVLRCCGGSLARMQKQEGEESKVFHGRYCACGGRIRKGFDSLELGGKVTVNQWITFCFDGVR